MSHRALGYLAFALLVVYGMVLPNALTNSASAHNLGWDLVTNGHLNYVNKMSSSLRGGNFSSLINLAEAEWQPHIGIAINEVSNTKDADVSLVSFCDPHNDLLGATYRPKKQGNPGSIRFNRCVLMHKCPKNNAKCAVKDDKGKPTQKKTVHHYIKP